MTVTQLPATAPATPAIAAPAATGPAAPADFLAALIAAVAAPAGAAAATPGPAANLPVVEQTPNPPVVEQGAKRPDSRDLSGDPTAEAGATPTLDPALAALMSGQVPTVPIASAPTSPRLDKLDVQTPTPTPAVEQGAQRPDSRDHSPTPVVEQGAQRPDGRDHTTAAPAKRDLPKSKLAVAGTTGPTTNPTSAPAEAPSSPRPVPVTAVQAVGPQTPDPTAAAAPRLDRLDVQGAVPDRVAVPDSVQAPNTAPLDRIASQVFGEITGLTSRGNGTHRITLTLNPEQLGEVKVVMTMRDGAVHVRLAAGQEARTSLVDGSPELTRMLEHAGATTAHVVVRELPTAASQGVPAPTSTPTADATGTGTNPGLGGDRSPDQHARTRADHQARDGSDHHTPRPDRAQRSNQPVNDARIAGIDLTM